MVGGATMTDPSTLSAATDNNQIGAHLRATWDEQRSAGFRAGKWWWPLGRFVTLAEWVELQKAQKAQKGMQKE